MIINKYNNKIINFLNFTAILFILSNIFMSGYPILGSDEYAYIANGKYLDTLGDLYAAQPHLQHTPTILYLKITNIFQKLNTDNFVLIYRIFQLIVFIFVGMMIKNIFIKYNLIDNKNAKLGYLIYLFLPCSFYINTIMPEILTMLISCLVIYFLLDEIKIKNITILGIILGASLLIKPNVLALILTANLYIVLTYLNKNHKISLIYNLFLLNIIIYLTALFLTKALINEWDFKLERGLGYGAYGHYISAGGNLIYSKIYEFFRYFLAHSFILFFIFTPVVFGLLNKNSIFWSGRKPRELSLLIILLLFSHIAMVSWFTAGTAYLSEGELLRLHGRYLNPVLIFMPFLFMLSISNSDSKEIKLFSLFQILALIIFSVLIVPNFKIYPWDYPMLFAFFQPDNWYKWNYADMVNYFYYFLIIVILLFNIMIIKYSYKIKSSKIMLIVVLLCIMVSGQIQTYLWSYSHLKNLESINNGARALKSILGDGKIGDGIFIADNSFGTTSFALFNMNNAPKVIIRTKSSVISQADIEGAKWVVTMGEYSLKFRYNASFAFGNYTFIPLNSNISIDVNSDNIIDIKDQLKIFLGSSSYSKSSLVGFNSQEDWGAWTKDSNAKIIFPGFFSGNVRLVIFGWTIRENLSKPVIFTLGNQSKSIFFSEKNEPHELKFHIDKPVNSISINSHISRPKDSSRDMGVAVNLIQIEDINAARK